MAQANEGRARENWGGPPHCMPQAQAPGIGTAGVHFMQHPPHLQPVYYRPAYPGAYLPGVAAHPCAPLFPLGAGRLPQAQPAEAQRPGWGGMPLAQHEPAGAERAFSGISLPGSLGSSPVASPYPSNGTFRGAFEEDRGPSASGQGASMGAGGHSSRHRSREDSATPCPFYMKTGTCAYGDMCALAAQCMRLGTCALNIPSQLRGLMAAS